MNAQEAPAKNCSRCGTAIEACAFCDEPDCPACVCYRCLAVALLDRLQPTPGGRVPSPQRQ